MRYIVSISLVITGIIHIMPLVGVIGPSRLNRMYGIQLLDPNLIILMRHRAVLFGLLGGYLLVAAFTPAMQRVALIAGTISVVSFFYLAKAEGYYNAQIARVYSMDVIAAVSLVLGTAAYMYLQWKS